MSNHRIIYQKQEAWDCLDLSGRVSSCNKAQVCKHDPYDYSHRGGTYQEHIPVLELFGRSKLKYEGVVDACLPPHEDVAAIEENVQEQEAKHAAIVQTDLFLNELIA